MNHHKFLIDESQTLFTNYFRCVQPVFGRSIDPTHTRRMNENAVSAQRRERKNSNTVLMIRINVCSVCTVDCWAPTHSMVLHFCVSAFGRFSRWWCLSWLDGTRSHIALHSAINAIAQSHIWQPLLNRWKNRNFENGFVFIETELFRNPISVNKSVVKYSRNKRISWAIM